mmetsp:Transcript_11005/g.18836  ORF Transcript_11005/g.18836 Transcript_11005/m.18836 type:complete len:167 (+) Transcript_11005:78-578(+)
MSTAASGPSESNNTALSRIALHRLTKELNEWLVKSPVPGMSVQVDNDRMNEWYISIRGAENTVYYGEEYTLRFLFPYDYPIEPPEVIFLTPTPQHAHVYTNGHICLNVLYDGWSPALTVTAICLSILSMLSSATEKSVPPDNDTYVKNCKGRSPKKTRWRFHDDGV